MDKHPRHDEIVALYRQGATYLEIRTNLRVSNEAVQRVVAAEGLEKRLPGRKARQAPVVSSGLLADQGGKCLLCEIAIEAGVAIAGPAIHHTPPDFTAIGVACPHCADAVHAIKWRAQVITNLSNLMGKHGTPEDKPTYTGAKYLDKDGPDVFQLANGRLVVYIDGVPRWINETQQWWPV